MKKNFICICLLLAVTALYAKGIQDEYNAAEERARISYAFGMIMGTNLESMPIEFDYNAFTEGLKAMLEGGGSGKTLFSEQEAYEIVETALQEAMEKLTDTNRQLEAEFLNNNSLRSGVMITASGLQFEIIKDAQGEKPAIDSVVRVHYNGTFIDGSLFDASYEEEGSYIPLEMVIQGWTEGLMLMSVGSKYRLYIPSNLAYGSEGIQGVIPPYSTLIFDVELLEITDGDF
ncbi:MAG: FKBP-type peptidyl-prolyl cis-trans isomerase [Treponema sp.]|nr:FKBP-type peptidyl-prolyl cis-trans isomerase [Treponema sp.]